jgi:acyl-CoA hydrolase
MKKLQPKHQRESAVETRYYLLPRDANAYGTAFGGFIMSIIDGTGAMAASRHCNRPVVTASIDSLSFCEPIRVSDHIVLDARVTYTGRTSMEISVVVKKENPVTRENAIATTAHLSFVAIDDNGKPCEIPQLLCETDDEKKQFDIAKQRVAARKALRSQCRDF